MLFRDVTSQHKYVTDMLRKIQAGQLSREDFYTFRQFCNNLYFRAFKEKCQEVEHLLEQAEAKFYSHSQLEQPDAWLSSRTLEEIARYRRVRRYLIDKDPFPKGPI